jgi:hypothetical protein
MVKEKEKLSYNDSLDVNKSSIQELLDYFNAAVFTRPPSFSTISGRKKALRTLSFPYGKLLKL